MELYEIYTALQVNLLPRGGRKAPEGCQLEQTPVHRYPVEKHDVQNQIRKRKGIIKDLKLLSPLMIGLDRSLEPNHRNAQKSKVSLTMSNLGPRGDHTRKKSTTESHLVS